MASPKEVLLLIHVEENRLQKSVCDSTKLTILKPKG